MPDTGTQTAVNSIDNTELTDMVANTIKGNATSATADPTDIAIAVNQILGRGSGDIVASQLITNQISSLAVTYAKIQNITATARILGRITSGAGVIEELTGTQLTTLLDNFTSTLKGLVPLSGGGTANYLRADGSWVVPPGTGAPANAQYVTLVTDATLSNERTLSAGDGLYISDGGAGQPVSINTDITDQAKRKVTWVDDFFADSVTGSPYFQISLTGGTVTNLGVSEVGVFGAWQLSTAASATGRAALIAGNANSFSLGQGQVQVDFWIKTGTLSTSVEEYTLRVGLMDGSSGAGNNVVNFSYVRTSSTFWRVECKSAGVSTVNTTATTVGTNWTHLKIVVNAAGTQATFFVDGTLVANGTITTNIPTGVGKEVTAVIILTKTVGTTPRTCNVDAVAFEYDLTTART